MYAYIDESGDMGHSSKSSKFFILTCFCISIYEIEKLEKDIRKYLSKLIRANKKHSHYFHAYKESDKTKYSLLNIINRYNYEVIYFVLDKSKDKSNYKDFVINSLDKIDYKIERIIISKYDTRKSVNLEIKDKFKHKSLEMILTSQSLLLQVADLFSWVIFQKIEKSNSVYYDICKNLTKQNP